MLFFMKFQSSTHNLVTYTQPQKYTKKCDKKMESDFTNISMHWFEANIFLFFYYILYYIFYNMFE